MRNTALILAFLSTLFCFSQDMKYIDSLLGSIHKNTPDSVLAYDYIEVAYSYRGQDNTKALEYAQKGLEASRKGINKRTIWNALNNIAEAHRLMGNYDKAIEVHQQALNLAQQQKYKVKSGHSLNNLALVYRRMGNQENAKQHFFKALQSYADAKYTDGYYTIYNNLGNVYSYLNNYDSSLVCYRLAYSYINKDWDSSYYAQNYNNMSMIFDVKGYKDSMLVYCKKSFDLYKRFGTNADRANSGTTLAGVYTMLGQYKKATDLMKEVIVIAKKSGDKNEIADAFLRFSKNYFAAGEYKLAYLYKDSSQTIYDELLNDERLRSLNEASEKYGAEKKQLLINQLNIENTAKETLLEEGKKTRFYMALGLGAIVLFSIYLFYTVKQRDKTNRIINEQKKEVEQQKALIEAHQKETLDSINYAKRIQYSLLAHEALLKENLEEYFVLFKPKDIVSGDFYWATTAGNKFYLAVCDSTGHGVPGAFMSLLNINFMNEAINEKKIHEPNEVFNHVRKSLIQNVSQDGQRDGMDGILVCIEKGKINYASANNSPVVISGEQMIEFPKDKMPVGAGERDASFNLHELKVKKDDVVYLYTDGFADQFGGEKGKKFKYKQLNELLRSLSKLPLAEQKQRLEKAFDDWKGTLEQVDDVCIIGIRI